MRPCSRQYTRLIKQLISDNFTRTPVSSRRITLTAVIGDREPKRAITTNSNWLQKQAVIPQQSTTRSFATPSQDSTTLSSRGSHKSGTMAAYDQVLKGKYPAKLHVKRVVDYIRTKVPDASGVLYLEGRMTKMMEDSDEAEHYRYLLTLGTLM